MQHVAIASLDGCLRVIDHRKEEIMEGYKSYFGGFTCAAWSPGRSSVIYYDLAIFGVLIVVLLDAKYILTGGQDDLVTVWQFGKGIVARCLGHSSWVCFDVAIACPLDTC